MAHFLDNVSLLVGQNTMRLPIELLPLSLKKGYL